MKFCASFTTLPSRVDNMHETIESIFKQTVKPDKIILNLPYNFKRFKNYQFTNEQIIKLKKFDITVNRCEDYGPGTKIMGAYEMIKDNFDCVILFDDDHIYNPKCFEIMLDHFEKDKVNYSFYLNKIFNINHGQCADLLLINTQFLNEIEIFYNKYVKNTKNMFLDDDLWLAIFLYCEKKTSINNLIQIFKKKINENVVYKQNLNKDIDALHQTIHKDKFLINRRKIQKIEFIKYKLKKFFNF
jgi:hypothetical protein